MSKTNQMIQLKIEEELFSIKQAQEELDSLKSKWIKTSSMFKSIKVLEFYIQRKNKLLLELKNQNDLQ